MGVGEAAVEDISAVIRQEVSCLLVSRLVPVLEKLLRRRGRI